ncbi:MAG: type II toxin-antitoxin system VapC family toxin [Deltaproteobacteria bacterium]|nr:type II toxin-antitoxin system VapC family toxin [Deltaproteobacteria bacterium]
MKFWDSSALLPLLLEESHSAAVRSIAGEDGQLVVWWGTPLECRSALARLKREGILTSADEEDFIALLEELSSAWVEILAGENLRKTAARLLMTHPLRAADALQLAAALIWSGMPVDKSEFVCLDSRLREAARNEGFVVLPKKLD